MATVTVNHEYYVSLEVAKLLKEAGFDWNTEFGQHIWDKCKRLENNRNFNSEKYLVSLPTLDVAQRWLREVKGYSIYPTRGGYKIYVLDINDSSGFSRTYELNSNLTYEESQEAAIKKVLEIILEKDDM